MVPPPLLLLLALQGWRGEAGPSPSAIPAASRPPPAAPERVRFQAHTFQHVLLWAPPGAGQAPPPPPGLLYDVQYKRYGNHTWTPVGRCTAIARRSCDLSAETAQPSRRYFARVRTRAPDGAASRWTPTRPFSPKEATLQLRNMNLSLSGNILRVTLELPVPRGEQEATLAPEEDLHLGGWAQYWVYVHRVSNNDQYVLVETNRTFELPALVWGERYCVSVEPRLPSRPNPAQRIEEQCVWTPALQGAALSADNLRARALTLALLGLGALSLVALASIQAQAYVKKPMETPSVLKSFQRQAPPWLQDEPRPLERSCVDLCVEAGSIHQVSLGLKDQGHACPARVSPSIGAPWLGPGKVAWRWPEAMAGNRTESPQLVDLTDHGIGSSDGGICLQEPLGSRSLLLPVGPLDCRGALPGGTPVEGSLLRDGSLGREEPLLQGAPPASQAEPQHLDSDEARQPGEPTQAQHSGYRRQAGHPPETLGSCICPPSSESTASGYLKQASVATLPSPGPLALAHRGQLHFLPSMALAGTESLPCLPEFPKAFLTPGFLEPPPHLSLLCPSMHLGLNLPWCRA